MAKSVLVVDDDLDFLELMGDLLSCNGYLVHRCTAAEEAYERAKAVQPAAIILDLVMPGHGGMEAIEQLKADRQTAGIPIVICSAAPPEVLRGARRLRELGCSLLLKPFAVDALLTMLAEVMAKQLVN